MLKASKETASQSVDGDGFEGRYEDLEDGYTVGFETFNQRLDLTPRLRGLPDGSCQAPHWGYVIKGTLTYKLRDRDQVIEAGDAFYIPPGHTLIGEEGTEFVFFSPTTEWQHTIEQIATTPEALPVS